MNPAKGSVLRTSPAKLSAEDAAAAVVWLPAERLGQFSVDGSLRPWLIGKGLLTQRLKAVCGERFVFRLVEQSTGLLSPELRRGLGSPDTAALFRDVEMRCGERVWVYAQTVFPDSTLGAHPWLAELGDSALGETLKDLRGLERSPYEYAWLPATLPLCARACVHANVEPPGLWARRSRFTLRAAPMLVQELFLPSMGSL
jgi:chorismate--pyruvate lyase